MVCKLVIDGVPVEAEEGASVLDAALNAGIYIPHLCKHPDLEAMGGCRLCVVELNHSGDAVPACMTCVADGMTVESKSASAVTTRNTALELILAAHPSECGDCPKYGHCELQSIYQYLGVTPERRKKRHRPVPDNSSNPLILHRFTRCILCGRCVRACQELRGVKVLNFQHKSGMVQVGTDGDVSLADAGCRFCGACIEVCPTGSILDQLHLLPGGIPYRKAIVPCRSECPAEIDIPRYLRYIKNGDYGSALAVIREKVPLPGSLGHVCNHACESKCKRNELGGALSVCSLKAFAAQHDDHAWVSRGFQLAKSGKKVGIVGAGPAGLTAAYYLKKLGHDVTVLESHEKAGGQLRLGIPAYRLPDAVLDVEVADILSVGIELKCGTRVNSLDELADYDAVLLAVGTHRGVRLPLPGNDLPEVMLNTEFLKKIRIGQPPDVPDDVVVLGGGNVAFDCARSAVRLGARQVHVVCLERQEQMTSTPDEIQAGKAEGVQVHDGYSFLRITGDDHVTGVEIKKIRSFNFDENHRAVIETVEGSEQVIPAGLVIFAVGQQTDLPPKFGVEFGRANRINVDEHFMSSHAGVFACGDAVTGTQSVIRAIAAGRASAAEIDRFLGGKGEIDEHLTACEQVKPACIGRCEGFSALPRLEANELPAEERARSFQPTDLPLTDSSAMAEASRCLQCDLRLEITQPKTWADFQ